MKQDIEHIVRFFLNHTEHYQWVGEPLTTPNAKGEYVCTIGPTIPDGLLLSSAVHLEKRIKIWCESPVVRSALTP